MYNSKIKLPFGKGHKKFSHTDCNWKRDGCDVPAPQCVVFTSPSEVDGQTLYDFKFVNMDTPDARGRSQDEVRRLKHAEQRRLKPYVRGEPPNDEATGVPAWVAEKFTNGESTSLGNVEAGDCLFMTQLTAHEVSQPSVNLTRGQKDDDEPISHELTRTAEYPMFVSPRLNKDYRNQSVEEVMPLPPLSDASYPLYLQAPTSV